MNIWHLMIGTLAISAAYALGPVKDINDAYLWLLPLEAFFYSLLVLYVLKISQKKTWLKVSISSALANTLLGFLWPVIFAIPVGLTLLLNLPEPITRAFAFSFYSSFGALVFSAILIYFLSPSVVPKKLLGISALLCSFAGLASLLPDPPYFVPSHKAAWWFLFSLALAFSLRTNVRSSANKTLQSPASQAGTSGSVAASGP